MTKQAITELIISEKEALGSLRAVATKVGCSEATLSQIINGKGEQFADKMWTKIASALDYRPNGWQVVETTNTKLLFQVFQDAKDNSMFMGVSHRAGSGKTVSGKFFTDLHSKESVFYIQAREWGVRQFLLELCRTLGISMPGGYVNVDTMLTLVADFFNRRRHYKPLLIIDEADKLKPAALRALIPFYNECEDRLGLVVMGTENLAKEIKAGVKYNRKGYDEIDSRFGRNFIRLYGAKRADVQNICTANGISDKETQRKIWDECKPEQVQIGNAFVNMISDLRRLKRAIQRELLRIQNPNIYANSN